MPINLNRMTSVSQAAYLTAQNSFRYRTIMRLFYLEHARCTQHLDADEIFEKLAEYDDFNDYSIEQLKLDLTQLCQWENITAIQDPRHVSTIEEYKNKKYRYSISKAAIVVERMTIELEHILIESGTLSTNLFPRILESLEKIHSVLKMDSLTKINEWWRTLQDDFNRLTQSYQDYIHDFYSARSEKLLQSVEFVLYKDKFITYLRDFVQVLQLSSSKIERIFMEITPSEQSQLIERIIASELDIPRANSKDSDDRKQQLIEDINGSFHAIAGWFTSIDGAPAESTRVMEYTNEIIRKILSNALLIVQMQNAGISRKDDYKKYLSMFASCENLHDAHCLSAHIFGAMNTLHFKTNTARATDSITSCVLDEEPILFTVNSKSKEYRSRIQKSGFEVNSLEKLSRRQKYFQQIESERAMVLRYIKGDEIYISAIPKSVPATFRSVLLRWIVLANSSSSKTAVTEFGQNFTLVKDEGMTQLHCDDGDLAMPNYRLIFSQDGGLNG